MPQKQPPASTALICAGASDNRSSRSGSGSATAFALIAEETAIAAMMTSPAAINRLSFMEVLCQMIDRRAIDQELPPRDENEIVYDARRHPAGSGAANDALANLVRPARGELHL